MNFIDAMIITLAFTPSNKREECRAIIKEGGVVNSLVLVEAHYNIENITKNRKLASESIRSILNSSEVVAVDHNLLFEALKRTDKYDLRIFDLIHYTTALLKGCSSIVSYDKHFDNLEVKRKEP